LTTAFAALLSNPLCNREKLNEGLPVVLRPVGFARGEVRMSPEEQWEAVRGERSWRIGSAGMGALRISLLFGSAAAAFALLATPMLDQRTRLDPARANLDMMSTGSISQGHTYTVRRSVLQSSPSVVCIIRDNGARSGDC
jgi:hypothetical protein